MATRTQPSKPRVRGRNKLPDEVLTTKGHDLGPGVLSCPATGTLTSGVFGALRFQRPEALAVETRDLPRPSEVQLGLEPEVSAR